MAKHLGRLLLVVVALATGSNSQQSGTILSSDNSGKDLGDVTCNADVVQNANVRQLYPILHDLVNTTFFRLFRVKLKNPVCPYWPVPKATHEISSSHDKGEEESAEGSCTGSVPTLFDSAPAFGAPSFTSSAEPSSKPACSIEEEEDVSGKAANAHKRETEKIDHKLEAEKIDHAMTTLEKKATEKRDSDGDTCEFEEDLPTFWIDMCGLKASDEELEDVNLIKNPERNTGYNGSHIWEAMYKENCFEVGSSLPRGRFGIPDDMCYEERILYRLLSGWHASTSISIFKSFYAPGTKSKGEWAPNPSRFMEQLGTHPDRLKNLYFSFVVMLRAVKKAGPFLDTYLFATDDASQDHMTRALIERLLDSQVLSLCSPLFEAFDETRLFRGASPEQNHLLKRQFKRVFQNITVLVDCVQCQRCRLHAKLFSLGLGTALKILLTPANLLASSVSRDELVALINVLWKLSEAMEDARVLSEQYWDQDAKTRKEKGKESRVETPDRPFQPSRDAISKAFALESLIGGKGRPDLPSTVESQEIRASLLDTALGAVRQAANTGSLSETQEVEVLRSLVVRGARPEVLLLAKHYADRPNLFAAMAFEAATAAASLPGTHLVVQHNPAIVGAPARPADAIIIGGGLAGMVATISLLDRGGSVVLVEKQPYLGGNSGKASSGINAALETTVESLIGDTTKSAGVLARPDLIAKLSSDSGAAVSWLMNRTSVDLSLRSQLGGHTVKRTLRPANAFVGAEVTFAAGQILKKVASDHPDRFRLLTKTKFVGLQPLPGGDGWRITTTPAEVGDGENLTLQATSLVIASGGFGHDHSEADSLLLKNRPDLADFPTTLGPQTTGDGVKLARDIGAKLVDMDRVQLHPTGFVDPARPQENTKTLAAELLRGVGGLLIDRGGKRFTDELGTRQAVVDAELKATHAGRSMKPPDPSRTFALVLNSKAAAMADRHVTLYSKKGLLTKVSGVKGLAQHLGAPVDTLQGTLKSYNNAATAGKDEFNRTVFPNGHWPIEMDEDFFVGKVVPVIHYTMGGVAIDTDAQVLREKDGKPIAHLYAIGEASGGVHGDNRLAGNSLLECTVFGRHVGLMLPIKNPALQSLGNSFASNSDKATIEEASSDKLRAISAEELAEHGSTAERKWVELYGQVYDLTDYVDDHPGGKEAILNVVGMNGTDAFDAVHNRELLNSMGFEPIGHFVA